ncbi:Carotenoid cleavage dioxygenase 8 B, chloroplastic [Neolecta irregularis DAH-3]|uniref:Carotenoid cleavage dioxygenase 8 B, chloroplastic n=1 Tax=Neolecta irregularis (strain DAH-3) TaxID=1198029 RepID=A0A1U7LKN3_NEOID|nr:Carotenoid cleavage dioxygenase 8 B, chloroplastic [Neolecta irregularis DAH-3]|eukprot:OLL23215.1 Carotenoid cleavage dioxygenase 8 B, chloroplastic [Neolecta irregularis DAH-3]
MKKWNHSRKSLFYVINKKGGLDMKLKISPFYCFHTINAYEEDDNIFLDCVVYEDHSIIKSLYVKRLCSTSATDHEQGLEGSIRRYVINRKEKSIREEFTLPAQGMNLELPVINPAYKCKKHRFVYGIHTTRASSFFDAIIKVDIESRISQTWSIPKGTPSEPIFIARPDGTSEDDGVLLTVVLDGQKRRSMMIVLDAKDLKEIARAEMELVVPFGFHGAFVGRS